MTSASDVIDRFVREAGTAKPRFLRPTATPVEIGSSTPRWRTYDDTEIDTVYSYGTHFPLAVLRPDAAGNKRGWWLVNGDRYSQHTTRHQADLRAAIKKHGNLPSVIVPFTSLAAAGIRQDTIVPVKVLPDRYTWEPHARDNAPLDYELTRSDYHRNWQQLEDGRWSYDYKVHHLGESVFKADYRYEVRTPGYTDLGARTWQRLIPSSYETVEGSAYFLSGYDMQEGMMYFLAQLPAGSQPQTVREAFEALKPDEVVDAEREGTEVLRQGDVFAVKSDWQTRELPGPSRHSEYVLGVNHKATEVRIDGMGNTFARGFLRHAPREFGRAPEHRMVKLGDGKTWYELVKNTVPEGRSWAPQGKVD